MSNYYCKNQPLIINNNDGAVTLTPSTIANTYYQGMGTTYNGSTISIETPLNSDNNPVMQSGFTITQSAVTSDVLKYTTGYLVEYQGGSGNSVAIPSWANYASVVCVGGGGSGGSGGSGNQNQNGYDAGSGGSGGTSTYRLYNIPSGTTTYNYSVGGGGAAPTSQASYGSSGGNSSVTIGNITVTGNAGGGGGAGYQPGQSANNGGGSAGTGQWYSNASQYGGNLTGMTSNPGLSGSQNRQCITTPGPNVVTNTSLASDIASTSNWFSSVRGGGGQGGSGGNNKVDGRLGNGGGGGGVAIFFFSGF